MFVDEADLPSPGGNVPAALGGGSRRVDGRIGRSGAPPRRRPGPLPRALRYHQWRALRVRGADETQSLAGDMRSADELARDARANDDSSSTDDEDELPPTQNGANNGGDDEEMHDDDDRLSIASAPAILESALVRAHGALNSFVQIRL